MAIFNVIEAVGQSNRFNRGDGVPFAPRPVENRFGGDETAPERPLGARLSDEKKLMIRDLYAYCIRQIGVYA
ncbi:hypothetical protein [Agrobacterium bohemicum]|uniref:hypothetical protein n=1 Tax=Agrobacterium bohemicum TaxID=2052828 RepID=UPI00131A3A81|nr:hypothetical protein [Agrobacterium bohemicum]